MTEQETDMAMRKRTNQDEEKSGKDTTGSPSSETRHVVYGLEDVPPWYATFVFGFQQFLASFGGILSAQFIVGLRMCMGFNPVLLGRFISTGLLCCGISTILQVTFGSRLAIIQGSGTFFVAIFAVLDLKGPCPAVPAVNATQEVLDIADAEWRSRILEVSGAILLASLVQIILGSFGAIGILLRFFEPLTITPVVTLTGLKLVQISMDLCGMHWGISGLTLCLIILLSQYLAPVNVLILAYNSGKGIHVGRARIFELFPIVIAIVATWIFCAILTAAGVFPSDPSNPAYNARTDISNALQDTPWFVGLYPGQFGTPFVTLGAFLGITAGMLNSVMDSIGDYYVCARISDAPKVPNHAVNRGILMEGISCMLAGAWGAGLGMASYSECVGNIGLTKVGSRVVAQVTGVIMIILALFSKAGGLFATLPYPIVGGSILVGAALVMSVGLSNLQFIDLNSTRNLLILGMSLSLGFGIPFWLFGKPGVIQTGSSEFDNLLGALAGNDVFVGGFIGFILDNTIPGTKEERGLVQWLEVTEDDDTVYACSSTCYDLPFGMSYIRKSKLWTYLPFSPTFEGFPWERKSQDEASFA